MTDGVAVDVLSSLTRTQSRFSAGTTPGGSHETVDTNARRLSFQMASVGRASTAFAIVPGPGAGCCGAGGSANPVMIERASRPRSRSRRRRPATR